MTKPKLTGAVTSPAAVADVKKPEASGTEGNTPATTPAAEESNDDGDADPEPEKETEAVTTTSTPAAKTLADFRSAFGLEQGSVYWSDSVSFEDACVKHMATQATTIAAQATEIAALKKSGAELAAKLKGEDEPLATGPKGDKAPATGDAAVSDFAKSLEARMNK